MALSNVAEGRSSTVLWPVGTISINFIRFSEAAILGELVAGGEVDTAALVSEVERIKPLAPARSWLW